MIKDNNTSSLQGRTSVLELGHGHSHHQNNRSDTSVASVVTCVSNNAEKIVCGSNVKHIREIQERSKFNDRRGRKQRNLFAVDAYNRRSKERRLNSDSSAV